MQVGAASHLLSVNLVLRLFETLIKLGKSFLVVSNGTLNLSLLDLQASNLFADAVILVLLERDELFGLVVLLFDLGQLDRDFLDLLLFMDL